MDLVGMAPDAVLLDRLPTRVLDLYDLRLPTHCEHGGVAHSVLGLEEVGPQDVVLGNVAVIAGGDAAVTAPLPRGELRIHDVAVHAGFGRIRQVRNGVGYVEDMQAESAENPENDDYRDEPGCGGRQESPH
jgi:hypothetical protein